MDEIYQKLIPLKQYNERIALTAAKELSIIDANIKMSAVPLGQNIARLESLCRHIDVSFRRVESRQYVIDAIVAIKELIKTLALNQTGNKSPADS